MFHSIFSRFQMAKRVFAALATLAAAALVPLQASAQQADPYAFDKKAYKPDGTPWSGPVNIGDTIKYVLSYKPGATNSGPATIDDTLSPNLNYVPATQSSPGWTWGSSPYATGNHEKYQHPGFGPGFINLSAIDPTGSGDGTIPIAIPSLKRAFGIFHHVPYLATDEIDCWELAGNKTILEKCPGYPKKTSTSGTLGTPMTPNAVVVGTKIYFAAFRTTGSGAGATGTPVIACFDALAETPCGDTVIDASQTAIDISQFSGVVTDGSNRLFAAIKDHVYCRQLPSLSDCWSSTSPAIPSVSGNPAASYSSADFVYLTVNFGSPVNRLYAHHGDGKVQCLDSSTGQICAGGSWSPAGISLPGFGSGNNWILFAVPNGGSDGGVCGRTSSGTAGCLSETGAVKTLSPMPGGTHSISAFNLPGTNRIYLPNHPGGSQGVGCYTVTTSSATPCAGFPSQVPLPSSSYNRQYGIAVDPLDGSKCMLTLGHDNIMWRFDYNTGKLGCLKDTSDFEEIAKNYCHDKPSQSEFKWTRLVVSTTGASGALTLLTGSLQQTINITSGTTTYTIPASFSANGYGPVFATFQKSGTSPIKVEFQLHYETGKPEQICYSATVKECGPVFNDAVFKAVSNGAPVSSSRKVDLGIAAGPDCDPKPPVDVSCLSGDVKVTCGQTPGTFVITLNATGAGGVTPDTVSIVSNTAGVTIVNPQAAYPVINGQVKFTVAGANPGDSLSFDLEGTKLGAGAVEGADLCCNGTIKVEIPRELECKDRAPIDIAIKKTGKTSPEPTVNGYSFLLKMSNEGAAFTPASGTLTINDVVPVGMTITGISPTSNWSCLPAAPLAAGASFTCTYNGGAIPAGPAHPIGGVQITATANGQPPFPKFTNCAEIGIAGGATETTLANNKSCVDVVKDGAQKKHDVAIAKKAVVNNQAIVTYGFTLDITNKGDAIPAGGTVTVTDVVPAGLKFTSVTAPAGWTCLPTTPLAAGSTLTCNYAGAAVPANTAMGSIVIQASPVSPQNLGPFSNCAITDFSQGSALSDLNMADNKSCATITSEGPPNGDGTLSVTKTCDPAVPSGTNNDWGGQSLPTVQSICHLTVTGSGNLPPVIELHENLLSGAPAANSPMQINISGMSSPQNWQFPAFPVPQGTADGSPSTPAHATISSADLLAAGGTSTIDVTVLFMNEGWASETQNCVQAFGVATPGAQSSAQSEKVCVPFVVSGQLSRLVVHKEALFNGQHISNQTFPVSVTCGGVASTGTVADGAPYYTPGAIPVGSTCTVVETPTIPSAGLCPEGTVGSWTVSYAPSGGVPVVPGLTSITITNQLVCEPIIVKTPLACDRATATNAGDLCRCRFDNMSPVSKTACECKDGFTLKAGQGCVRKVIEPKCDPATTVTKGGKCLCEYKNMVQTSASACACTKGFRFAPGKGCFKPEPVCRKSERFEPKRGRCEPVCAKGFDYNPKRNACIQRPPVCGKGTVFNPKRNRCDPVQPVCRKPFVFDPKRNACVEVIKRCEPGTIPFKGRCVPLPKCPRGQIPIPGTPICVAIGGGGGGPKGPDPEVCRDGDVIVPCR